MFLSKKIFLPLSIGSEPRKTRLDMTEKISDWDVKNQNKTTTFTFPSLISTFLKFAMEKYNLQWQCVDKILGDSGPGTLTFVNHSGIN